MNLDPKYRRTIPVNNIMTSELPMLTTCFDEKQIDFSQILNPEFIPITVFPIVKLP